MRELKFRAWSLEYKCYVDVWEITFDDEGLPGVLSFEYNGLLHKEPAHDFALEQYTGLKDKNGLDIYEGDIVKARWFRAKNARFNTRGEVKFNDGWFYIHDDPDGQDRLGVPIHNCYDMEIIGNIHEDPELLEEKE